MTTSTALPGQRTARPLPYAFAGLTVLLIAGNVALAAWSGNSSQSVGGGTIVLSLTFLTTGLVLARRQPANPIGWLFMCTGLFTAFTTGAGLYDQIDYGSLHGRLPFGALVYVANATWPVSILTGMAAVLLFPDGKLTRPWRAALRAYVAVGALVVVTQAIPAAEIARNAANLRAATTSSLSVPPGSGAFVQFLGSGLPLLAVVPFWAAWIVRQVIAFRRARGDVRQQYKWFTAGGAVSAIGIVVFVTAESGNYPSALAMATNTAAIYVTALGLPLCIGVAILRYRLYDIDRIISRTLSYAIVTGLLAGVYAAVVLLATALLPVSLSAPELVATATLIAAGLFNPLRRRVQKVVDRRFNRARYDADRIIAAFADRVRSAVDIDAASADLLATVRQALEPANASLWLSERQHITL